MEFQLLGQLEVVAGGEPVVLRGRKPRALLAVLLLNANRVVSVERLVDALWEDRPPESARQTLQYFVHLLRKALATAGRSDALLTQAGGYLLKVEAGELDTDRFALVVGRARQAHERGDLEAAAAAFDRAMGLWRGPALADFAEERFAQGEIARLEELRLTVIEEYADVRLALGRHAELVGELEGLVRAHALRERPLAQLILALYRSGRQVEALGAYRAARRRLVTELGIEPNAELQRLEQAILAQDPSLELPAEVAGRHEGLTARSDPAAGGEAAEPAAAAPDVEAPPEASAEPGAADAKRREADAAGGRTAAGGDRAERKLITVLVARVTESVMDPEDQRTRHAEALRQIRNEVERYGGVVYAAIGGTVLSAFGIPRTREDDPERAIRAALRIASSGVVRVGVDTGEVVVAPPSGGGLGVGSGATMVAGISGTVVDTASSLLVAAPPGGVLAGPATFRATQRVIEYEPLAKGADTGGDLPRQPRGPRSRIGMVVYDPGARSPLIERKGDLDLIHNLLLRAREELGPQLVTVVGVAGLGKTRLVGELGQLVESDPDLITWRQGRSVPSLADPGERTGFWALAEVIRAHAGVVEGDDVRVVATKLRDAVTGVIDDPDEAATIERYLRPLVGLDGPELVGAERRREAFARWSRFLEAVAAERPLALVMEDLQWADEPMLDFVEDLVDLVGPVPLLVVATARPELLERRRDWSGGKRNAVIVSLTPLSEPGSAQLLDTLLAGVGIDRLPPRTRKLLLTRAGGNPLYLEEYVRMLRDEPRRLTAAPLPIPQTIQQLITGRLDDVDFDDKLVLQDLAVLGEANWIEPLVAISGFSREEVVESLSRLERRELLRRTRATSAGGEPGYIFRHSLIRDVAYGQLMREERVDRHRRAAEWLERQGPSAADRADLLARHYERVIELSGPEGLPSVAARMSFRAAGDRAASLGSMVNAVGWYEHALALWPQDDPGRPELLLQLGLAMVYGRHAGAEVLLQAREAFAARDDDAKVNEVDYALSLLGWFQGNAEEAEMRVRGVEVREPVGDGAKLSPEEVTKISMRGFNLLMACRFDEAAAVGNQVGELARSIGNGRLEGYASVLQGQCRLFLGAAEGNEDVERGLKILEEFKEPGLAFVRVGLAEANWWCGELKACEAALEAARATSPDDSPDSPAALWIGSTQTLLDFAGGRWDEAERFVNSALSGEFVGSLGYQEPPCRLTRARIRLGHGDIDGALADAEAAIESSIRSTNRRYWSVGLALKGRVLVLLNRLPEAIACLEELLADAHGKPGSFLPSSDLAALMVELGRPADALPADLPPTRWRDAALAFIGLDFEKAAALYASIGSNPDESISRLRAAVQLAARGRVAEARVEAQHMLDFATRAGATTGMAVSTAVLAGLDG